MTWEARTNFSEIKPGTRLCIYERMQIGGQPPASLLGDVPLAIEDCNQRWIEAKIEGATTSNAILVMPDGVRFQISPRREGEFDSGVNLINMYSQDWIVRSQMPTLA